MKKLFTLSSVLALSLTMFAQNPAGNAFRIDYNEFTNSGNIKFLNCGNNDILNPGDELTVMLWMQMRDIGDNQKIVGKFNLDNTGYILAVDQGRVYAEVWNPTHYEPLDGLMNPTAQHWHHIAFTYTRGDALRTYINGVESGVTPVSDNPISTSENNLIIGVSSWTENDAFQAFGNYDEVALYNRALSAGEIQAQMFKELVGSESDLIAAYNFNVSSGTEVLDLSGNDNTANGNDNFTGSEWIPSWAPIADDNTEGAMDLAAVWNGLSFMDPRASSTEFGLNLIATNLDTAHYAVFGHDGSMGITMDNIPSNAPSGFERAGRIWPMTVMGEVTPTVVVNLESAAGGGTQLSAGEAAENYTLLYRAAGASDFVSIASGTSINGTTVVFEDVTVYSGDYSIGVGSAPIEPSGVNESTITNAITIVPNPSNGQFEITVNTQLSSQAQVNILDLNGKIVEHRTITLNGQSTREFFDINRYGTGVYVVRISTEEATYTDRITIR